MTDNQTAYLKELQLANAQVVAICNQVQETIDALQRANDERLWLKGSYAIYGAMAQVIAYQNLMGEALNTLLAE